MRLWFTVTWLSIKSKVILMLVGVSLISIGVITYLGHTGGKRALSERIFAQLTGLRASKAYQIESYFRRIRNHAITLSEDRMIIDAMGELKDAFHELEGTAPEAEWTPALTAYYRDEMLARLDRNVAGTPVLETYLPRDSEIVTRYLQYHYIAANPNPVGKKHLLDRGSDASRYGRVHEVFHPILRDLVDRLGYYDLLLIDLATGDVVYSVLKETDFATNLESGPYSDSKLAEAFAAVKRSFDRGTAVVTDFGHHRPSYGRPAAFIASPVFDGPRSLGVVAFELSSEEIGLVMTGGRRWHEDGLGETGETYLVGPDHLMRSDSRFLIESRDGFLAHQRRIGVSESMVSRIERLDTTILEQRVDTAAVEEALAGRSDTREVMSYRRVPVLSSYMPLDVEGLGWALLCEIELGEVMQPVREFSSKVLISSTVIMILVTVAAMGLAELLVRPIRRLRDEARRIREGKAVSVAAVGSQDEVGDLARALSEMVESLNAQAGAVEAESRESERLLLSLLPKAVAQRLRQGERHVADSSESVTVLVAELSGTGGLARGGPAGELIALLDGLISLFDEATERHGVEKVKTCGPTYVATSGLRTRRLDHARCAVDFVLEAFRILKSFNLQHSTRLGLAAGIASGTVAAGLVGRSSVAYDLWGETVATARRLAARAAAGEVLVSQRVYEALEKVHGFREVSGTGGAGEDRGTLWRLSMEAEVPA